MIILLQYKYEKIKASSSNQKYVLKCMHEEHHQDYRIIVLQILYSKRGQVKNHKILKQTHKKQTNYWISLFYCLLPFILYYSVLYVLSYKLPTFMNDSKTSFYVLIYMIILVPPHCKIYEKQQENLPYIVKMNIQYFT